MTTAELIGGTMLADRYIVERPIGSGGMATVYSAIDHKHQRQVAIKVLRPEIAESVGADRFLREIEIAANLQHPNILPLYDSGEWKGQLFYVMPFVEGESLRDRMQRDKNFTLEEVREITSRVALALDYSHSRGVVHRDIKPENIMLTGGSVVVADFGIARALSAGATPLTVTGLAIGTPAYMSPEQGGGGAETTGASDQYSLACMVYEMLTGEQPFAGANAQSIILRHWRDPAPKVRTRRGDLPAGLETAIVRALAKNPTERFTSVGDFASAVNGTGGKGNTLAVLRIRIRENRRKVLLALAGVAVLAVGFGGRDAYDRIRGGGTSDGPPVVAVLPFKHVGHADEKYVAEGLTDEITGRIAGIRSLRTISSASATPYAGRPLEDIAKDLGARYVVTGVIKTERQPNGILRLNVQAQLTDLRDRSQHEIMNGGLSADIVAGRLFEVQSSVARGVASALSLSLDAGEQKVIDASGTSNPEAYAHYLRAVPYATWTFEERRTRTAIDLLQKAADTDSGFALAFAKLAQFEVLYYYYFGKDPVHLAKARSAVDHATKIDATLPEARIALGFFYYLGALDYTRAQSILQAVRDEQPNNSELLWMMGSLARRAGRVADARPLMEHATKLNPRSALYAIDLAVTFLYLHDYSGAERETIRCISLDSAWFAPYLQGSIIPVLWKSDTAAQTRRLREGLKHSGPNAIFEWTVNNDRWDLLSAGPEFQSMLEALNYTALGIDSGAYQLTVADWRRSQGDSAGMRKAAATASTLLERAVQKTPERAALHGSLGVAYAMLGKKDAAIREGQQGMHLLPTARDALRGPEQERTMLEIYLLLGDVDAAAQLTKRLITIPFVFSAPYVRVDPHFVHVRNTPQFQAFLNAPKS